jgi:hypothetical protein
MESKDERLEEHVMTSIRTEAFLWMRLPESIPFKVQAAGTSSVLAHRVSEVETKEIIRRCVTLGDDE